MTVSPHAIAGAGAAASYYAQDNYYAQPQEGPSLWGGQGAEKLGLAGSVLPQAFEAVLDGRLPGDIAIGGNAEGKRSPGFDLTFSPPKTVSLAALIGGDARVIAAHDRAVASTMRWVEERFAIARAGKGGEQSLLTGNLLYAAFRHDLSRSLDPQLHTHVVIANATQRPDGAWRALHNVAIWRQASLIGAAYHAELRVELEKAGYRTELTGKHGQFEISGISRQTVMEFSGRRADILAKADALGLSSPQAMEAVALRTRSGKDAGDAAMARVLWAQKGQESGAEIRAAVAEAAGRAARPRALLETVRAWGEALLERVTLAFGPKPEPLLEGTEGVRKGAELAAAYSVAAGVRHLSEREASFGRMALVRAALDLAGSGTTVRGVEARITALEEGGTLIAGKAGTVHAERLTTRDLLQTERALFRAARVAAGSAPILVAPDVARVALHDAAAGMGITLSTEQEKVALSLLSGSNAIQLVQGDAGTGKSTLFTLVDQVARQAGREVLVLVPQNKLIEDLAGQGLAVRSLESVLQAHGGRSGRPRAYEAARELLGGRIVVLEEASMVSSRQMAGLFAIAERGGVGKLALVGDAAQIGPVEAGRAFALLQEQGAPTERLSENRRQQTDQLREAAALARAGDIAGVFAVLAEKIIDSPDPARSAAEQYLALSPEDRGRTAILTSGHVLREAALGHLREGLLARGELGDAALTLRAWDSLNLTREQTRQIAHWAEGMRLDIHTSQAGLARGSYDVTLVDRSHQIVELMRDGTSTPFDPADLEPRGSGAALSVPGEIEVRAGDRLLFTATDHERDVTNGTQGQCVAIEGDHISLQVGDRKLELLPGDPLRDRLGHAAVLNMHRAQGLTVDQAITVMNSHDTLLNSESLHYVLQTRAREDVTLHTDDRESLREAISEHPGEVAHALDLAPELAQAGGERFDGSTGELLEGRRGTAQDSVAALHASLSALAAQPVEHAASKTRELPEREIELSRGIGKSEPQIDFGMGM
jgi:conjugative relaxase-like TrwC/TraI family protein